MRYANGKGPAALVSVAGALRAWVGARAIEPAPTQTSTRLPGDR